MKARASIFMLMLFAASAVFADSATLELRVRDFQTDHPIRATIKLEGPESVTLQTDYAGAMLPGEYRVEVSAPGYKLQRTHLNIGQSGHLNLAVMMDAENPPEEERPEAIAERIRPGFTLLHGYVVNDAGMPLVGVKVRLVHAGVETETDSKGHYWLSTPTPQPTPPAGEGTDTLIYEKPGYKTMIFENFGISEEEMGGGAYGLEKGRGVIRRDATHKLMREEPNLEEPQSVTPGGTSLSRELSEWLGTPGTAVPVGAATMPGTVQTITVPGTILVGTGGSSTKSYQACSGRYTCTNVVAIPLEDYVSNGKQQFST